MPEDKIFSEMEQENKTKDRKDLTKDTGITLEAGSKDTGVILEAGSKDTAAALETHPKDTAAATEDAEDDEADEYAENDDEIKKLRHYMKKRISEGKELFIPDGKEEERPLLELRNIYKIYRMGTEEVRANDGISVNIYKGDFVAIVGKSGSGKSTLMNIIGALDVPTRGDYHISGEDVAKMTDDQLAEIRNKKIGFIFQQYNLLPKDNLRDNVALPLLYAGLSVEERNSRAMKQLERVGLKDKWMQHPSQLSGGQQQRVSIARALAGEPELILADEPTGALDSKTSRQVLNFLKEINDDGNTVVMITHDNGIAMSAKRIVRISDGRIVYDGTAEKYAELI